MIAYFTLLVGEHCSRMMINGAFEHKHHNVLMICSLLIVYTLYPNVVPTLFLKQNSRLFSMFFPPWIFNQYLGYV